MENNLIIVTDFEPVEKDNFYLSKEWGKNEDMDNIKEAKKLQKDNNLFYAYIVDAKNYAIFYQMDSDEVFINRDCDVVLRCESQVIGNKHQRKEEYTY